MEVPMEALKEALKEILKEVLKGVLMAVQFRYILVLSSWYGRCLQHRSTPAREPSSHPQFQDTRHCQSILEWHQADMPADVGKLSSPI